MQLMPLPPNQKADSRMRILKSARYLFNRKGFAPVTIDEIMAEAGLTRGGFYKHFNTKEE
jgi:AcrR family transcriptional regulator